MPSIKEIYNSIGEVELNADSINLNVDGLEALASTQQADVALIKADLANGVTINQPVAITAASLPLPSGAATSANQTTANTSLSSIDGKLPSLSGGRLPVESNLRDGSGNAITSTTSGASRRLDVMLSSGGTTGSTAPTNANLVGGTDGTNLRAFSTDTAGRVNVNPVNQSLTTGTGTASGTSAVGTDLIASTDVSGFAEASVQFTGIWPTGATVTPQVSNDNSTWVATTAQSLTGITTLNATGFTATNLGLNRVVFAGARYFRLRVTGAGSAGTYDFAYTLNPRTTSLNGQGVNVLNTPTVTSSVQAVTNQGHSTHHTATSAASTNATNVKASNTNIGSLIISNTSSSIKYLKLFNLTVAPTMGTSSPVLNYAIMPNSTMAIDCGFAGIRFPVGLSYAITSGQALLDNTAVGAGDVVVNIAYV